MKRFALLLCGITALLLGQGTAAAEPAAHTVPDTMAQRMQACTTCHGKEGRATRQGYFPRIAGKPAGYLYNQLVAFRDSGRQNGTMAYLLANTSDAYLRDIAEHFATLDLPYPAPLTPVASKQQLVRGEMLVRQGDAQSRVPACMQCHGPAMTGVLPAVPGLLGLPSVYLSAQLGAWRTGLRKASTPDCMAEIARRLSADDISAVAAWLASQPVPTPATRLATVPEPAPMDCGSGPK
jgi:cytochrome c553